MAAAVTYSRITTASLVVVHYKCHNQSNSKYTFVTALQTDMVLGLLSELTSLRPDSILSASQAFMFPFLLLL